MGAFGEGGWRAVGGHLGGQCVGFGDCAAAPAGLHGYESSATAPRARQPKVNSSLWGEG